ncbi:MAG: hypothetical protein RR540_02940 [Oscillospiraceae bacterium]
MSTFDNFITKAKKYVDVATVKTNEFVEVSRIEIEKSQLNSKLRELYCKLGRICFNMSKTGNDESEKMSKIINKINEVQADIDLANENLGTKKYKNCPICNNKNSNLAEFCSNCGEKI